MTEEELNLTRACDAVAKAICERDMFKSNINAWEVVRIGGYNLVEMDLADREFVAAVKDLCAAYFDRKVARATEMLKAETAKEAK